MSLRHQAIQTHDWRAPHHRMGWLLPDAWRPRERLPNWHTSNPQRLHADLEAAIEQSKDILALEDDWDDHGSPGYSDEVWERATAFLRHYALRLWHEQRRVMVVPQILPGPDASIDLHWDLPDKELLVNIPATDTGVAGFYGDDRGDMSIKGTFRLASLNHGLLEWLAKMP